MQKPVKLINRDKGERKGWPTIRESKNVRLSEATRIIVFNPLTGLNKHVKFSI